MSFEKIPIISEKVYKYEGLYDIKETYKHLVEFLENSKHYDVSEKDFEEANDSGKRKIKSKSEAELKFNDYYKIILKYELTMEGVDIDVKVNDKKTIKLTKGTAKLSVNCYIEPDWDNKKKKLTALGEFLDKVYTKLFNRDELDKCINYAATDVGQLIAKFKQQMNSALN